MEKDYNLSLYDIKSLKKLFKNNSVVAYGNGSFFNKIKEHLKLFNLEFVDILYTQNDKVVSTSGKSYEDIAKNSAILICSSFSSEILKTIKNQKNQPKNIKIATFLVTSDEELNSYKQELAKAMQKRHEIFVQNLKSKEKIRVVFLVLLDSVWKVDPVFKKMLDDPYFEPVILVIPYTSYGEERMWEEMTKTYEHFKQKDYPTISSYNKKEDRWITLDELNTDIVFFTAPHNLTKKEYYEDAYLNYLSVYVPYYFMVTRHGGELKELETNFFIHIWKVFSPHFLITKELENLYKEKKENFFTFGYPAIEIFISQKVNIKKVWKSKDKINLIYSPHHTIENNEYSLSTFLEYGDFIKELAIKYKNNIHWTFKPHPNLKYKLYKHKDWRKDKTDNYYKFWESQSFTQFNDGEYEGLFLESDAIIHDCSSFIVEYAFMQKPSLYLYGENTDSLLNEFGRKAMQSYEKAWNKKDIEEFLQSLINNRYDKQKIEISYINNYIEELYKDEMPSDRIIKEIKKALGQDG